VDLKAERRINDELKKEVHELRMTIAGLETSNRTLRQEEELACRRLAELRDANKLLEAERDRALAEAKRERELLEEQLRGARERARELASERDEASRGSQVAASARNEEIDRQRRSLIEAEARSDSLLQELNALRHQAQLQRAREQDLDDALRAARRELVEERSNNRAGQEQLLAFLKDRDQAVEVGVKIKLLEETLAKLRGELKSALQDRDALKEEREALLDAYEALQLQCAAAKQATAAGREEEREAARTADAQQRENTLRETEALLQAKDKSDQECKDLRSDKENLIASVALMNNKLQDLEARCRGLQEKQGQSERALEAADALAASARARQVELEEEVRVARDSKAELEEQLRSTAEERDRERADGDGERLEVQKLAQEAVEMEHLLEETKQALASSTEEWGRERERISLEAETLRAKCKMLEVEVESHARALEVEEHARAECSMRLQLALEQQQQQQQQQRRKSSSPLSIAQRRSPSPVAQHCHAAQLALQKVTDITSRKVRLETSPQRGAVHEANAGQTCQTSSWRDAWKHAPSAQGRLRQSLSLSPRRSSQTREPASITRGVGGIKAPAVSTTPTPPTKFFPPTPPPATPPLTIDTGGARLLGGGGVTANTPPKPKVLRGESQPAGPSPPVSLSQGVDGVGGGGGREGGSGSGGEGVGDESLHDSHVRGEGHGLSWSSMSMASGTAGDSVYRGGAGAGPRPSALCPTPARPSMLAQGLWFGERGVRYGDAQDREALGEEEEGEEKGMDAEGRGMAGGEAIRAMDSRPSRLGGWGVCVCVCWRLDVIVACARICLFQCLVRVREHAYLCVKWTLSLSLSPRPPPPSLSSSLSSPLSLSPHTHTHTLSAAARLG